MQGRLICPTVRRTCRSPCCTSASAGRKPQLSWTAAALCLWATRRFALDAPGPHGSSSPIK